MKVICLILVILLTAGCVGTNSEIKLQLVYSEEDSSSEILRFKLVMSTDSESEIDINTHTDLVDSFMMRTIKDLNLCKIPRFYRGKRSSKVKQVKISKNSPYVVNFHADYRFDHNENIHVYDFGRFGKVCKDVLNDSFILAFTFYEAESYGLTDFFKTESDGVTSNMLQIN